MSYFNVSVGEAEFYLLIFTGIHRAVHDSNGRFRETLLGHLTL